MRAVVRLAGTRRGGRSQSYRAALNQPVNPFAAESAAFRDALLRDARTDFPQFYAAASELESSVMDSLVLTYASIVAVMNAPSDGVPLPLKRTVDRASDALDQSFAACREAIRAC